MSDWTVAISVKKAELKARRLQCLHKSALALLKQRPCLTRRHFAALPSPSHNGLPAHINAGLMPALFKKGPKNRELFMSLP